MRYQEIRKVAERIAKERHVPIDSIEIKVSVCPNDSNAEDGIRYFGTPHEAMENQGGIMICSDGERNISRKDDAETLLESVRRLVGEWREQAEKDDHNSYQKPNRTDRITSMNSSRVRRKLADELSAIIDGKDSKQEKL